MGAALAVLALLVCGSAHAHAQDLPTQLAGAEEDVAAAQTEIAERAAEVQVAESDYEAAVSRAAPLREAARSAQRDVRQLQVVLRTRERDALAQIAAANTKHEREVEDHDEQVRDGVGFGLAALVAALIAIGWGWFRASAAVAALSKLELAQAAGLCAGGGFLMLVVGVALGASMGVIGALGAFLAGLGLILPVAFLLARHSARIQRGLSKPILRRERLPAGAAITTAVLMLLVFASSTGSALFAEGAASETVSAKLRDEADAASKGSGAEELTAAEQRAALLGQRAVDPNAQLKAARSALNKAKLGVGAAERRLVSAERDTRRFAQLLAAQAVREEREAAKLAAQIERESEEQAEEESELAAEGCHPSYSGCLDPSSPDYDCSAGSGDGPDYTGTVTVYGYDEYELDDDSDGIGCESG